jgi:hypothetical protein
VGLSAADLHEHPGVLGDLREAIDEDVGELFVAVFVEVLH